MIALKSKSLSPSFKGSRPFLNNPSTAPALIIKLFILFTDCSYSSKVLAGKLDNSLVNGFLKHSITLGDVYLPINLI